jgi:uncharacterized protein (TIGR00299 family) protein
MGAAGDMLMAALLELHDNPTDFLSRLNSAGIPGVEVTAKQAMKCGIMGTHVDVMINGQMEEAADGHYHQHEHEHEHEHEHDEHHHHHPHEHEHSEHHDSDDHVNNHNEHHHVHEHEHGEHYHGHEHEHEHGEHHHHHPHEHKHSEHHHSHEKAFGHEHEHVGHHISHGHEHSEHHHNHEHAHGHEHEHSKHHEGHEHDHAHTHTYSHNHTNISSETPPPPHSHNNYSDIEHLIHHLSLPEAVKQNAAAVYKIIAEAESHAHGVPVTQIHFHEVGEMDAVADIVGVCMLIHELAPDVITASPVNVGSGQVRCAHGILPVPAPATAHILRGIPIYSDDSSKGELCTPTGAALLKHFAAQFCKMPVIITGKIGYGMGKKDFEKANCVRAFMGETDDISEEVAEFVCNLDDMTPEAVAFAQQQLFEAGALDVYTTAIGMKKSRAGISLTCMCRVADREKMLPLIFKYTSTLGVREYVSKRYALRKEHSVLQTQYGAVRVKTSRGYGVVKSKPEYDDIAALAKENDLSLSDVIKEVSSTQDVK